MDSCFDEIPREIEDRIHQDFPFEVVVQDYGKYVDATIYLTATLGKPADWCFVGGEVIYVCPEAVWERHEGAFLFKTYRDAVDIKLRFA